MKKIYVIAIVLISISILIGTYKLYELSAQEASKKTVLTCQLGKLAIFLTEHYRENKKYPIVFNKLDINVKEFYDLERGCGIESFVELVDKNIKDPWGDELVFENLSEEKIVFYSINHSDSKMILYRGTLVAGKGMS